MKMCINLFLLFIYLSACKGQNACDYRSLGKTLSSISSQELLFLNKQIIPCLIDSIDVEGTSLVGFMNPISSSIDSYHFNQKGIRHAYNIDYILSKDSVETVNKTWSDNEDFLHWEENTRPERIYDRGIIVKKDDCNNIVLEALTYQDMINIKKMYFDWWRKNKEKPIEILREEFRRGNKILKLPYMWI